MIDLPELSDEAWESYETMYNYIAKFFGASNPRGDLCGYLKQIRIDNMKTLLLCHGKRSVYSGGILWHKDIEGLDYENTLSIDPNSQDVGQDIKAKFPSYEVIRALQTKRFDEILLINCTYHAFVSDDF